jgi:cell division protein FtsN
VSTHSKAAGAFVLQVGAYKSNAEARAAWRAYEAKHPLVGGYEPDIRRVELAGKGTWYRLRIGAFANSAESAALCEKLKADGATCFPAKR